MLVVKKHSKKSGTREDWAALFGCACRRLASSGVFTRNPGPCQASILFALGGQRKPGRNDLKLLVGSFARNLARAASRRTETS